MKVICALILFGLLVSANVNCDINASINIINSFKNDLSTLAWQSFRSFVQESGIKIEVSQFTQEKLYAIAFNLNKAIDDYNQALNTVLGTCTSSTPVLTLLLDEFKIESLRPFNALMNNQLNSFDETNRILHRISEHLRRAQLDINAIKLESDALKIKKFLVTDYNNGTIRLDILSGYKNALFTKTLFRNLSRVNYMLHVSKYNIPSQYIDVTVENTANYDISLNSLNNMKDEIKRAFDTIEDVMMNIGRSINNSIVYNSVPSKDEIQNIVNICDLFTNAIIPITSKDTHVTDHRVPIDAVVINTNYNAVPTNPTRPSFNISYL